ncbi:hypothetical protein B4Q13_25495, partial [Lacticaseibacillus rhamnosus]
MEQGNPALLNLFARYEIPLTCFIEGWSAGQYPDYVERVLDSGHEVGMHGWTHERWAELPDADHVQGISRVRELLKTKTAAHPLSVGPLESGDEILTYATIKAQGISIPMPPCKIDVLLNEGDSITVGDFATIGH